MCRTHRPIIFPLFFLQIMVAITTKLIIFSTLCFITKLPIPAHAKQQVPCVFFFGDSLSDNGNNNFLISLAKVNYPPYGIDYPAGPTGTFSNGRNIPDFLAEYLGFEKSVPPFATARGAEILLGVNYASGGAGILDHTSSNVGGRICMNEQLLNHRNIVVEIGNLLGSATLTTDHLNKCLYVVNIGSNDYINNYLMPPTSSLYSPQSFAEILIQQYHQQLMTLYKYGARKVAVFGVGLIGLVPAYRSYNASSIEAINNYVGEFNIRLKPLIDSLNLDFGDAHFIFINNTNIALEDPSTVGIEVKDAPCCVTSKMTGLCYDSEKPCTNRNQYYFWDNFHPTETANRVMAERAYVAASPADAYPTDIRNLVRQY